jgi:hypothetical protein
MGFSSKLFITIAVSDKGEQHQTPIIKVVNMLIFINSKIKTQKISVFKIIIMPTQPILTILIAKTQEIRKKGVKTMNSKMVNRISNKM